MSDLVKRCEEVRSELIDALMGRDSCNTASLDPGTQAHLGKCAECKAVLEDLMRLKQAATLSCSSAEASTKARLEAGYPGAFRAIEAAVDHGLKRRRARAAWRELETRLEKAAFLSFAAFVIAVQALLFRHMKLTSFLVLEAGLNWLAPLALLIATFLRRPAKQRKEGAR